MAEFCYDCAIKLFPGERGFEKDFKGLCNKDEKVFVLCEGCGEVWVDREGKKIK